MFLFITLRSINISTFLFFCFYYYVFFNTNLAIFFNLANHSFVNAFIYNILAIIYKIKFFFLIS